jgi:sensor domain CHASE-containing protein
MNTLAEKIALWGFLITILAVFIAVGYATLHLALGSATKAEMNARFDKLETQLKIIHEDLSTEISSVNVKVSDNMVDHLSTAHVGSHSD